MTANDSDAPGIGEARTRSRNRRIWSAMLLPGLMAVGILEAVRRASGGSVASPAFAVAFAFVITVMVAVAAIWHHRVIDEQEERAILWGNTAGLYVAIVSAMIADVFAQAGLMRATSHVATMVPAFAAALLAYGWVKYR